MALLFGMMHLIGVITLKVSVGISVSSLGLWCFPHHLASVNERTRRFELVIGLSSEPGLLLFHFLHHPGLLLLFLYPLVITSLGLCASISHFWFLLLFFFRFFCRSRFGWFFLVGRPLPRWRTPIRTFLYFLNGFLLDLYVV